MNKRLIPFELKVGTYYHIYALNCILRYVLVLLVLLLKIIVREKKRHINRTTV